MLTSLYPSTLQIHFVPTFMLDWERCCYAICARLGLDGPYQVTILLCWVINNSTLNKLSYRILFRHYCFCLMLFVILEIVFSFPFSYLTIQIQHISIEYSYTLNCTNSWFNSPVNYYRDRNTGIWDEVSISITGVSWSRIPYCSFLI